MIENQIFKNCVYDEKKVLEYGFIVSGTNYIYEKNVFNNSFKIVITIKSNGLVIGTIYDLDFNEIYSNYRIESNIGEFAGKIRNVFIALLEDIRDNCFFKNQFVSIQGNRLSRLIKEKYDDNPYFEWDNDPNCGVFKNKETKKWYAIIMNVSRSKFGGSEEKVDIVNLKIDDKKIPNLLGKPAIYPAYHMNKKYWISVVLDETLNDNYIMELVNESYQYSKKK